jgi:flagellin
LSSGFRINRAADDAAGLAVSEKLKAQIGGLNQASRNAQDGISMIQTAEGALDEVQAMMQRMRDLAVQAASDTNSQTERDNINLELDQLGKEIDSISSRTKFNGQLLLDGSLVTRQAASSTATVGTAIGVGGSLSAIDVSVAKSGTTYNVAVNTTSGVVSLSDTVTTATATYTALTAAGQSATLDFATFGIKMTISSGTSAGLTVAQVNTALNADTIVTATGSAAAVLQTGANKGDETSVALVDTRLTGNSITGGAIDAMAASLGTFKGTHSRSNASDLIDKLDNALNFISSNRAVLGAAQNRLQHTIANLSTTAENLSASNSRIRDVDVATESSAMAKSQVLTQAGVAVLAQANQMPQLALKLLS